MKILIIEDDDDKARDLKSFVESNYLVDSITVARSFQSGLREALTSKVDLILLDMTMRNFDRTLADDGGRPRPFGGKEILRQMSREEVFTPAIVVTQFERFGEGSDEITIGQLKEELGSTFPQYRGTVQYRADVNDWYVQLAEAMDKL